MRARLRQTSKIVISATLSMAAGFAQANFRSYEAPVDQSSWQFSGSPIGCQLQHKIPSFGEASFAKKAGKSQPLQFQLGYARNPNIASKTAELRSIAPAWKPALATREMGKVKLEGGKRLLTGKQDKSWQLLNELEVGYFPTFYYQEQNRLEDQVSVALSAVGFLPAYEQFLDCLATLVPYQLNELNQMTVYFDFDRASIRQGYQDKLHALAQYVKHDPSLEVVFLNGYADNKGSRRYNKKLSQARIDSVMAALKLEGVEDIRFKTNAHGERKPAHSNSTAQGRAKNRRVFIRFAQS